ncbi:hypothetical protein G7Z17_g2719 [Cylindrodendrum hubeiense]|uniref:NmrA-like domain-containing protein n=1 Tax=Cylindrodendrum hubeiense TaxID=595255 RepID=A0A9P5LBD7_9HYPO|nr:hypothetical protein G7Z17_g2719 [Cylindrodendrum hubeiense]
MSKILAVFGATGQQGSSVVNYVLNDPELSKEYKIRAITRDVTSEKAKQLAEKVEVVQGDILDNASLKTALAGAHTVFAMTSPGFGPDAVDVEYNSGKAIADAALEQGVEYIIFSTLKSVSEMSGGKYTAVTPFDAKAKIEKYVRGLTIKSAFYAPAYFMQNLQAQPYLAPQQLPDGTWVLPRPVSPKTKVPYIDAVGDSGKIIGAILAEPDKYEGKTFHAAAMTHTYEEIVAILSKVTGKTIVYKQISVEDFRNSLPFAADLFTDGVCCLEEYGYFGPGGEELILWSLKCLPHTVKWKLQRASTGYVATETFGWYLDSLKSSLPVSLDKIKLQANMDDSMSYSPSSQNETNDSPPLQSATNDLPPLQSAANDLTSLQSATNDLPPPPQTARTSRFHYVIWASNPTFAFCAGLSSVLANRYPIPTVLGFGGEGENNLTKTHIAKLRVLKQYLDGPNGAHDSDLVMAMDGYDVVAQLPVDTVIERYFEVTAEADKRLADRFGITVKEAHARGLRQTVMFAADKGCHPPAPNEPRCWAIPSSHLPHNVYGPLDGNKRQFYVDPVFLCAGSVIGRLGDLRQIVNAALKIVEANDLVALPTDMKPSDQRFFATVFARQEVYRTMSITGGEVPGYEGDRMLPKEKKDENDKTEYHITIDYESAIIQNVFLHDLWLKALKYSSFDHTATVEEDVLNNGDSFKPHQIQMPASVLLPLRRIFGSFTDKDGQGTSARKWVANLKLRTNVATRQIYAFLHNTGPKDLFIARYKMMWYFPMIQRLLNLAVEANIAREPLTLRPIDGRDWVSVTNYPEGDRMRDPYGGAYTDLKNKEFIPFLELCEGFVEDLFKKEG